MLRFEHVTGIGKARLQIFRRDMVVFAKYPLEGPTAAEQIDHEFDGDPCPLDDRLASQDLWVHRNVFFPVHFVSSHSVERIINGLPPCLLWDTRNPDRPFGLPLPTPPVVPGEPAQQHPDIHPFSSGASLTRLPLLR